MNEFFATLFHNDVPLLDVRSEVEFAQGAFPTARNLPILTTEERHQVGILYKQQGAPAAIALGESLVSGRIREERVAAWREFVARNPGCHLYCFRGGLRSQGAQQLLREAGVEVPRIEGGYKALRRYLLETLETLGGRPLAVVSGFTGSGKTALLRNLGDRLPTLDLEDLARHRGSAFGKRPAPQPTQIDFENTLAIAGLKHARDRDDATILIEDESRMIGRLEVPAALFASMQTAPLYVVEVPRAERALFLLESYLAEDFGAAVATEPDPLAWETFRSSQLAALAGVATRLGGLRTQQVRAAMDEAFAAPRTWDRHLVWIEMLLDFYYDPLYAAHLRREERRIRLRGSPAEIRAALLDRP